MSYQEPQQISRGRNSFFSLPQTTTNEFTNAHKQISQSVQPNPNKTHSRTKINNERNKKLFCQRMCCLFGTASFMVIFLSLTAAVIILNTMASSGKITTTLAAVDTTTSTTTSSSSTTTLTTTFTTTTTAILYIWNTTGTEVVDIPGGGPNALAVDSSNALYVAEGFNNRIQKYVIGSSSNSTTVAGQNNGNYNSTAAYLHGPNDVTVDSNGNVYVTDLQNNRIQMWNNSATSGTTVAGMGGSGSGLNQLIYPYFMYRDPSTGTLYISDNGNNRVMCYLSGASTGTIVAGGNGFGSATNQLQSPSGVYYHSTSNSLIIANYLGNNIVRWKIGDSNWTLVAGSSSTTPGNSSTMLYGPMGLTLDPSGNIYVADQLNHRIQFFANQSNGTTIAGITGSSGNSANQLSSPKGVALDSQLNLYVADWGNNRIMKFSRS